MVRRGRAAIPLPFGIKVFREDSAVEDPGDRVDVAAVPSAFIPGPIWWANG
jgi:hypothetical protein